MNRTNIALSAALLACLLVLPSTLGASSPERQGDDGSNIAIRLDLSDGEYDRPIQALVLDGQRIRTTTGWRVPTAMTVTREAQAGAHGATYEYQNVGLGVTLQARIVGPTRIRISGEVELGSIVRDDEEVVSTVKTPTVETFRHVFDVIVKDGDGMRLAEVPRPGGGSAVLTIVADIQE